ncbi:hypothetical protein [Micromonospora sp. CA-111912]|uniref:hypothetical protein n=1 Tax=Micromonospora sp. CA-111912 TaxID=3239955 RepID=UPI003D8FE808
MGQWGVFALGTVMTLLAAHRLPGPRGKPFLSTGLIGGFTTWPHFNMLGSLGASLVLAAFGLWLGGLLG